MRRLSLLLALCGALSACGPKAPEIGRGLPSKYADAEPIFDQRVRAAFPVGTAESSLIDALKKQGFEILPRQGDVHDATFRSGWIVGSMWSVRWRVADNRVTEIWGVYGSHGL